MSHLFGSQVEELGSAATAAMADALQDASSIALLDYPNHVNVGDAAIWLGERAALANLEIPVAYVCDQRSYVAQHVRQRIGPTSVVVLHGGGNLGDMYPRHQRLRERVLRDFPDHRVLQLPQSAAFVDPVESLPSVRRAFVEHGGTTIFAREKRSFDLFADLSDDVRLVPDSAFCIGAVDVRADDEDVVWLGRTDGEANEASAAAPPGTRKGDWPPADRTTRARRLLSRMMSLAVSEVPATGGMLLAVNATAYGRLAATRVAAGLQYVGSGASVVTDRLHGHILATIAGRPSYLYDNSTGKVSGFHEQWTSPLGVGRLATSSREALELALSADR